MRSREPLACVRDEGGRLPRCKFYFLNLPILLFQLYLNCLFYNGGKVLKMNCKNTLFEGLKGKEINILKSQKNATTSFTKQLSARALSWDGATQIAKSSNGFYRYLY